MNNIASMTANRDVLNAYLITVKVVSVWKEACKLERKNYQKKFGVI